MSRPYQGYEVRVAGRYLELYDYLANARIRAKEEVIRNPGLSVEIHTVRRLNGPDEPWVCVFRRRISPVESQGGLLG